MKLIRRIGPLRMEALKVTAIGGLFWFAWAFACYQTVFLQNSGFAASDLGLLNALAAAVSIVSVSFWGMISDRSGSPKKIVFLVLAAGSLLYSLIPLVGRAGSVALFTILLPLFNFFRGSMTTLIENLQVRNCNELRLNFGFTRSVGSLLFTIGSLLAAFLLNHISLETTFPLSFLLMIPVLVLCFFVRSPSNGRIRKKDTSASNEKPDVRALFRIKPYVWFLVFALLFYIAYQCGGAFIPFYMTSIGISNERYGIILAYRAFLEIPFLMLMTRLKRRFSLQQLLLLGVALIFTESLLLCFHVHSLPSLLFANTFYGLGNGLFIGTSLNYLYQLAPSNLKATAQSFFAATASISGIIGNLLGGLLFDAVGAKPFYFVLFLIYLCSALVFGSSLFLAKRHSSKAGTGSTQA